MSCYKKCCLPPSDPIEYVPFTYRQMASTLDEFIKEVYPFYDSIVSKPIITQKDISELFAYLNNEAEKFVLDNPYIPEFQKIFTLIRNDGVVTIDKVTQDVNAYMVQISQTNQVLTNVNTIRDNSGSSPPIVLPNTVQNVTTFSTLKVYSDNHYDVFDLFTTRKEVAQSMIQTYGWAERPAIYVTGTLYTVAKIVTFSSGLTAIFRMSYLRKPS